MSWRNHSGAAPDRAIQRPSQSAVKSGGGKASGGMGLGRDQIAIRTCGSNRVVKTVGACPWTTAPTAMENLADCACYNIT